MEDSFDFTPFYRQVTCEHFSIKPEQLTAVEEAITVFCKKVREVMTALCKIIKDVSEALGSLFAEIAKLEPRPRYKVVRKLGSAYIPYFFKRSTQYHCRNNC